MAVYLFMEEILKKVPTRREVAPVQAPPASNERPLWIGLCVILAAAAIVAFYGLFDTRSKLESSQQRETILTTELQTVKGQLASAQEEIRTLSAGGTGNTGGSVGDHISVQHILIGFKDAIGFQGQPPAKAATRTQEEARTLAYELLDRAKAGEDYDQLVSEHTDDSAPGIYAMANSGVQPAQGEFSRDGMVAAFGDVGFALQVGEIGIADYDPSTSPFGYHIIKRVK